MHFRNPKIIVMKHHKRDLWEFKKEHLFLIHAGIVVVFTLSFAWYIIVGSEFSQIVFGATALPLGFFLIRNTVGYVWGRKDAHNTFSEWAGEEALLGIRETMLRNRFNDLCAKGTGVPIVGYWLGQKKYSALLRALHEAYYKRRIVQPL